MSASEAGATQEGTAARPRAAGAGRPQRASLNALAGTAGYALPMLVTFAATPLLLHRLGQAGYGLQNLAAVVAGYLAVMDSGLDVPITKFVAEDRARHRHEAEHHLLNTTIQLYLWIGVAGMAAIAAASDVLARAVFRVPPELLGAARTVFVLAGIGFLANVVCAWGRAVANGCHRYDVSNLVSIGTSVGGTLLGLGAVYAGLGVVGFVGMRVGVSLVAGGVSWTVVRRLSPEFRASWGLHRPTLRRIRGYLGSGLLLRVTGLLTNGLDRTLIAAWLSVAAVGIYAVPLLVVTSLGALIASMVAFTFPMASALSSSGRAGEMRAAFLRTARFVAGVASLAFPLLFVDADVFLRLWVGPAVAGEATLPFRIMLFATYFSAISITLVNNLVVGMGRVKAFTGWWLARALGISAGYVVLIRPLGIRGAALALLVGTLVEAAYANHAVARFLELRTSAVVRASFVRPVALGLLVAAAGVVTRPLATTWVGLSGAVAALSVAYVAAGFAVGVFDEQETRAAVWLWQAVTRPLRQAGASS